MTVAAPVSRTSITDNLSPAWFAAVMGTAVVPLAISFLGDRVRPVSAAFTVMAAAMFVAILGPWVERMVRFRQRVAADLRHPIAANFFPTMPIALILLALDLLKYPDVFFTESMSHDVAWVLFLAGAVGVYTIGLIVLPRVYGGGGIDLTNANFAWYIPPVSHLIIPVAGLEIAVAMPQHQEAAFLLSMVSLGVGFFLFLLVGATVYQRYVVAAPPAPGIAATSFIGVAPPAILAVILFKMIGLADAGVVAALDPSAVRAFAVPGILATWGFAVWAFVVAVMVVWGQSRSHRLPFALSWWAFIFPTGALSVAGGVAWKASGYASVQWMYTAVTVLLVGMWAVVAVRTVVAMRTGKIFIPAH